MKFQEEAIPGLGLLMALATADGPLQPQEQDVLLTFLAALRSELGVEPDRQEDEDLIAEFEEWAATAKSIQDNASQLYAAVHARTIFPRFFASMGVADGIPNDKERIMIGRIHAAMRSVCKSAG